MSDFSNYAENAIGNHILRGGTAPMTAVTAPRIRLYTAVTDAEAGTGTEVSTSGTAYAPTAVTWGAPSNGVLTNSGAVTFTTATASWGTVTHFAVDDGGSNLLSVIKALAASKPVGTGDTLSFAIGALSFTIA